jgi:hypothetical protein
MNSRLIAALAAIAALTAASAPAAAQKERTTEGAGLTIYNAQQNNYYGYGYQNQYWNPSTQRYESYASGYAVVKEWRKLKLDKGKNTIRFTDVAKLIDATTVYFKSMTDPTGTSVLEQNFEYDLVSADKILSKYIGRPLTLVLENDKTASGTLLSYDATQIVLQTEDKNEPVQIIQRADNLKNIKFSALPGGLITQPTLVWLLDVAKAGEHLAKVTYQTNGMSWLTDYTVVIDKGDKKLDLAGWVTITNQSGAVYKDAELKLVAGDVNRAPSYQQPYGGAPAADMASGSGAGGFVEKSFFEYHMYTLGRTTTLSDNSIKQIELFDPADGVPAKKIFHYFGGVDWYGYGSAYTDQYYGNSGNKKVDIYLEFDNDKKSGMGIPLPAGRVRVYKKDEADGSLELIGEDRIDHTPRDEKVRLKLGSAFDVVGERKQTDFKANYDGHEITESFEIKIRNHKDEDVEVLVKEVLFRWSNWNIEKKSQDFTKDNDHTIYFPVKVKKNAETVVTYTVKYTW